MATRPPRFTPIPVIPQQGLEDWQYQTLVALKNNLEMLTGARGTSVDAAAVIRGQIRVNRVQAQKVTNVSARGSGYTIEGVTVPSLDDYNDLRKDVQQLADDIAALRSTLNELIEQLRG